jgi:hypothetical protein
VVVGDTGTADVVVVEVGAAAVVVVLAGAGTVVVVVVVVVNVVDVVEVVVVELVVVAGSVVVVAGAEVVVAALGPYDQTYCGPGSPVLHASQSTQVGQYPAAASASGCSISQRSVSDARQVKVRAWALPGHRRAADTVAAGITHRVFIRATALTVRGVRRFLRR